MPTWYSYSADILCLSSRALGLSGTEAPANSGLFCLLRLLREIVWAGAVYKRKMGLGSVRSDFSPQLLLFSYLPCISQTPTGTGLPVILLFRSLTPIRMVGPWMFALPCQVTLLSWCPETCCKGRGGSGSWFGASALSQFLLKISMKVDWLSTFTGPHETFFSDSPIVTF